MTHIEILNRRLGDTLGRPNGTDPRFAWKHSAECFHFVRRNMLEGYQRKCMADRIGKCWLLCQWRPPEVTLNGVTMELTREQWHQWFRGERPYPARGEYKTHSETALPFDMPPTDEATAFYIATLREQMERAELANRENFAGRRDATTEQCEAEAEAEVAQYEKELYQMADDWTPASWKVGEPHDPGDRDGAIAFQVGGSRDDAAAA